jgi:hypothetical protein
MLQEGGDLSMEEYDGHLQLCGVPMRRNIYSIVASTRGNEAVSLLKAVYERHLVDFPSEHVPSIYYRTMTSRWSEQKLVDNELEFGEGGF